MNQEQPQSIKRGSESHYRLWPALCGDIELAREVISRMGISDDQKAHWLLNSGAYQEVERMSQKVQLSKGIKFRMVRKEGSHNPYQDHFRFNASEKASIIDEALQNGALLSGGIGDHIEQISQLYAYMAKENVSIPLLTNKQRYKQLEEQ